jgi:putative PIN family toxin of toxin-antitoxin system
MNRIVLDSNCLLQIVPNQSEFNHIWQKIKKGKIILCVTTDILNEYEEVLSQFYSSEFAKNILFAIENLKKLEKINIYYKWTLITEDYDDNKFVDCAISANAQIIVTNDKHFNVLKTIDFPKIEFMNLVEYAKKIKK